MEKRDNELQQTFPLAYAEVMSSPLSLMWSTMEYDRKLECLKGITNNMRIRA